MDRGTTKRKPKKLLRCVSWGYACMLGRSIYRGMLLNVLMGIFEAWGVPMFVGSVPWALLSAWLGYRWSLNLVRRFRGRRRG